MLCSKDSPHDSKQKLNISPLRVLVVEDDPDTARVLQKILARSGFAAHTAGSYRQAVEVAAAGNARLADQRHHIARQGRPATAQHPPAGAPAAQGTAVSGRSSDEDAARSRAAGFAAHLVKPVNPDQLIATIGQLFAQS